MRSRVDAVQLRLYADDTTLCIRCLAHCPTICCEPGSQPPVGVVQCKLFVDKQCQVEAVSISPCKYDFDLTLNGSGVTKLPSIRILGVELDSMLNFIEHISSQLKKAYAKTAALRRIRPFVPMGVMLALYKSFILPHLEYCSPLLLGVEKAQANKIEDNNHI